MALAFFNANALNDPTPSFTINEYLMTKTQSGVKA